MHISAHIIKNHHKQIVVEYRNIMKHIQLIHFIVSPTFKIIMIIKIFFFITVTICPKKCSFLINDLRCEDKYSLGGIILTIGNWERSILDCPSSRSRKFLDINCSSWSAGKSCFKIYIINK